MQYLPCNILVKNGQAWIRPSSNCLYLFTFTRGFTVKHFTWFTNEFLSITFRSGSWLNNEELLRNASGILEELNNKCSLFRQSDWINILNHYRWALWYRSSQPGEVSCLIDWRKHKVCLTTPFVDGTNVITGIAH